MIERLLTKEQRLKHYSAVSFYCDEESLLEHQDAKSISSLIKWLDDPCTEHDLYLFHCEQKSKYDHRKDCPRCWKELTGEKDE
jgi:hypothetical protein